MKKYMYMVLVMLFTVLVTAHAQNRQEEYLGLPGDNLNLYAVMKLFQESETLEGFERKLNDKNSIINNLDLDGDGYVDYIRVIDNVERNVHYIVLQVAINSRESQDVAVFTVVKESDGNVQIQLIGDEALYGRNYIIEPYFDNAYAETPNPGYVRKVRSHNVTIVHTTTYEIAAWPVVRFIFHPTYVVWHSPWYYNYYPVYWSPWNPYYWHYYHGYHYNLYSHYYSHYRHWNEPRYTHWHTYYAPRRSASAYVSTRIHEGHYKTTYSRPDQRREGTALYNRTYKGSRSTVTSSGSRRTSVSTGTTSTNRTTGSGTRKSVSSGTRSGTSGTEVSSGSGRRSTSSASSSTTVRSTNNENSSSGTTTRSTTGSTSSRRSTSAGSTRQSTSSDVPQKSTPTTVKRSTTVRQTTKSEADRPSGSRSSSTSVRKSTGSKSSGSARTSSGSSESGTERRSSGRR